MGLIKAAKDAVGSTLHDQWKEYIKCDDLGNEILMKKVSTPNGIISKDSAIQVAPGQIAVIFDSGKVLDATAEEGIYTFDQSSSPTFFAGQFGDVFKEMWTRFTYGGGVAKEQAVFYMNAKEIMDNKFGTPAPVPFQDWSHPIPNQMTGTMTPLRVEVKCFGKYTFKISDPSIFMSKIAGTATEYRKEDLCDQMRSEVIGAFQNVLNELGNSEHKVPVLELPSGVIASRPPGKCPHLLSLLSFFTLPSGPEEISLMYVASCLPIPSGRQLHKARDFSLLSLCLFLCLSSPITTLCEDSRRSQPGKKEFLPEPHIAGTLI